jgi:hypothetical protein
VSVTYLLHACFSFLFFCNILGFSQVPTSKSSSQLNYVLQTETKAKGVVAEVKIFDFAARKDFIQLILNEGSERIVVYVCPKPFGEEMGIAFTKGDQISVTGSKVKQEESEVILAREVVKGGETLVFRDNKGSPVWDLRTGK